MAGNGSYITEQKRKELETELIDLKGPKRKEIIEALEYAKSLGDLSENAEYHQAREDQGKIEARIQSIEQILQNSKVVIPAGGDVIEVGSKLVVRKEDSKEELKYVIVGYQEANITEGKISNRSPFGQALYGKKKGDSISFETPRGIVNYKIISVS